MKKQKIKRLLKFQQNIIIFLVFIIGIGIGIAFANISRIAIINQSSDSGNILIKGENTNTGAYYVNNRNNSAIIGNYLEGYYYDTIYGWFKFDWSTDKTKNVRVVSSTEKCSSGYGYNLGGKAKSDNGGYIDFSGVYYCLSDKKLHGKGFNSNIGYQDFNGIAFEIITLGDSQVIKDSNNTTFSNDNNTVENQKILKGNDTKTSNAGEFKIGGNEFYIDDKTESIFYIIK